MTDGAEWVADFMGNARREPTQGRELQLLRALRELAAVLDENQRVGALVFFQRGKAGDEVGAGIGDAKYARRRPRVIFPGVEAVPQNIEQRRIESGGEYVAGVARMQQLGSRLIHHFDIAIAVDDENTGAHTLHDKLVEILQFADIGGTLECELLRNAQSLRENL